MERSHVDAGKLGHALGREFGDVLGELVEAVGMVVDVAVVDPAFADQDCRQAIKESKVGFRQNRQVQRGGHRRFRLARIDDDNLRLVAIAADALPENRMRDAQVGPYEDDHIGLFQVFVGIRRGVKTEGLFVRGHGGGHALPRVAVAVPHAHAELGQSAKESHFLGGDLARAEKGDRVRPVFLLDCLGPGAKRPQGRVPIDRPQLAVRAEQRRGGAVVGLQDSQRLPALGTSHAKIHGIVRLRSEVHCLAVAEMDFQSATGRTEAADHRGHGIGGLLRGDFSQTETARIEQQVARQVPVAGVEKVLEAGNCSRRCYRRPGFSLYFCIMTRGLPAFSAQRRP